MHWQVKMLQFLWPQVGPRPQPLRRPRNLQTLSLQQLEHSICKMTRIFCTEMWMHVVVLSQMKADNFRDKIPGKVAECIFVIIKTARAWLISTHFAIYTSCSYLFGGLVGYPLVNVSKSLEISPWLLCETTPNVIPNLTTFFSLPVHWLASQISSRRLKRADFFVLYRILP